MHLKMHNFRKNLFYLKINKKKRCFLIFRRLRLLASRSDYFRSELTSFNHQTFFLPNDQAFASFGSGLNFLFDNTGIDQTNDVNDVKDFH